MKVYLLNIYKYFSFIFEDFHETYPRSQSWFKCTHIIYHFRSAKNCQRKTSSNRDFLIKNTKINSISNILMDSTCIQILLSNAMSVHIKVCNKWLGI